MTSSVIITNGIIEDKRNQVARIEAEKIANYVAKLIVETVAAKQSMPEAEYNIDLNLPDSIAGKSYYIDISNSNVKVGTYDGKVTVITTTFNSEESGIFINNAKISGSSNLALISEPNEQIYKLDFGTGDSFSHSPVKSGYYRVDSEGRDINDWVHDEYPYRIPILVENPSDYNIVDSTVKVVLNTSNFDYDHATVIPINTEVKTELNEREILPATQYSSDIYVYEEPEGPQQLPDWLQATVIPQNDPKGSGFEYPFYDYWRKSIDQDVYTQLYSSPTGNPYKIYDEDKIYFNITALEGGYSLNNIVWNGITLHSGTNSTPFGELRCISYTSYGAYGHAFFDRQAFFNEFFGGSKITEYYPYSFVLRGVVLGPSDVRKGFFGEFSIGIKYGEWYVRVGGSGTKSGTSFDNAFDKIQDAIENATASDTIYVEAGTYTLSDSLIVNKKINIVSNTWKLASKPIIRCPLIVGGAGVIKINNGGAFSKLVSLVIKDGALGSAPLSNCNGIFIENSNNISIINCQISQNYGAGLVISNSAGCIIKDSTFTGNYGVYFSSQPTYCVDGDGIRIIGKDSKNNYVGNCVSSNHVGKPSATTNEDHDGILMDSGANRNTVYKCSVYGNTNKYGDGIEISNCNADNFKTERNEVIKCNIYGNNGQYADGVQIFHREPRLLEGSFSFPMYNWIVDCNIHDNGPVGVDNDVSGIFLTTTTFNRIINCTISNTQGSGIFGYVAHHNIISNCRIYGSYIAGDDKADGITFYSDCQSNVINECDIYDNEDDGIEFRELNLYSLPGIPSTRENNVSKCNIYNNKGGIFFQNTVGNHIKYCNIYKNDKASTSDGIYLYMGDIGSEPNYIYYCNIFDNNDDGLSINHYPGSLFTGGNIITNNNFYCNGRSSATIAANVALVGGAVPVSTNFIALNNFYKLNDEDWNSWDNTGPLAFNLWHAGPGNGNWWSDYQDNYDEGEGVYKIDPPAYYTKGYDDENPQGPESTENESKFKNPDYIIVYPPGVSSGQDDPYHYYPNELQKAIDNVTDGGTILLKYTPEDWYYSIGETIFINKSMRIIGEVNSGGLPTIKLSPSFSGYSLFNVTSLSDCVADHVKKTVYIENLSIDGNLVEDKTCINLSLISPPAITDDSLHVSNCVIKNFNGTYGRGIHIKSGDRARITNCEISRCDSGIYIENDFCNIIDNQFDGNSYYGILISAAGNSNNIYHNSFGYNSNNYIDARDLTSSSNNWDNGYPSLSNPNGGGNYWYYYYNYKYSEINNTIDVRNDFNNAVGGDNIVDKAYTILGVQDDYPFVCHPSVPIVGEELINEGGLIPISYAIDYWNPKGESVLLLKMNINASKQKQLYLYYGGGGASLPIRSIYSTAVFYDGFDTSGGASQVNSWFYSSGEIKQEEGYLILNKERGKTGQYIISNWGIGNVQSPASVDNKHLVNEVFYNVEASVKFDTENYNKNQVSMILLTPINNYDNSNLITVNYNNSNNEPNDLFLHKAIYAFGDPPVIDEKLLKTAKLPDKNITDWFRIKSSIYISRNTYKLESQPTETTGVAEITSNIFDFESYTEKNNTFYRDWQQNGIDKDGDGYPPFWGGKIGLGCGLFRKTDPLLLETGYIKVDWIRVLKMPLVAPNVTIGSKESYNLAWINPVSSAHNIGLNAFYPSPVLCDYNYGDTTGGFIISNLDAGTYSFTIDRGRQTGNCNEIEFQICEDSEATGFDCISYTLPQTLTGQYSENIVTFHKTYDDSELSLIFNVGSGAIVQSENMWYINSLIIEKNDKGIKLQ